MLRRFAAEGAEDLATVVARRLRMPTSGTAVVRRCTSGAGLGGSIKTRSASLPAGAMTVESLARAVPALLELIPDQIGKSYRAGRTMFSKYA